MPDTSRKQDRSSLEPLDAGRLAETVRAACIEAALQGYEDAKISGLCHDGAWECAVDAIRMLDVNQFVEK